MKNRKKVILNYKEAIGDMKWLWFCPKIQIGDDLWMVDEVDLFYGMTALQFRDNNFNLTDSLGPSCIVDGFQILYAEEDLMLHRTNQKTLKDYGHLGKETVDWLQHKGKYRT